MLRQPVHRAEEMVASAVKAAAGLRVNRDVEMHTPFLAEVTGIRVGKGQRVRQILETAQRLLLAIAGDDLMKVHRLVKATQLRDELRLGLQLQRGAEVQLAQPDARAGDALQRPRRLLKLDREMAGVVVQADVAEEIAVLRILIEVEAEELQRLATRLKQTERFRLQTEVQIVSAGLGDLFDVLAAQAQVFENRAQFLRAGMEGLVRGRERADAAADTCREQFGQQIEEQVRVVEPLGGGPVRLEDMLLHPRAVKRAIRESVDGEDVAAVRIQPRAEFIQLPRRGKLPRRLLAEPQTDPIRLPAADAVFDAQGVLAQPAPGLLPRLAAVDVRAVAQMDAVIQ